MVVLQQSAITGVLVLVAVKPVAVVAGVAVAMEAAEMMLAVAGEEAGVVTDLLLAQLL